MLNPVPVNMQAVPKGLERYNQFINWRLVPDTDNPGEYKKLPCDLNGKIINSHDRQYWLPADKAAMSPHGIAFVFADTDPFWFIDLDGAWDGHRWSDVAIWARDFFPGCAIEVSLSGKGLHLFGCGSHALPRDHGCKNTANGIELYTTGRFCALTGTHAAGDAWIDFSGRMAEFVVHAGLKPRTEALSEAVTGEGVDPRYTGPTDDDELIRLMCGAAGSFKAGFGAKCHAKALWEADRAELTKHWPVTKARADGATWDWSAADAALMWHLSFWTGRDAERMARLFERSALYRPGKYEGRDAYRLGLLIKSGVRNPGVYDRPRGGLAVAPVDPVAIGASMASGSREGTRSTMELAKQVEHFKGCVYVQNAHAVLVPDGRLLKPSIFDATFGGYSFQMQFDNGRPTTEAFKAFTQSRMYGFPKVADTCFRPDRAPDEIIENRINVWRPIVVDEAEGDITPFLNQVAMMIPDAGDRAILFTYMKSLARNPGVKFQWAPVIQGVEGNGKSMLIRVMYRAVTKLYSHLPKASQLTEKYNSWLERRIFIGVEEIKVSERREVLEDLKDAVTNDWIEIRGMQQEKRMSENYTNWIFCTNHKDAIPVDENQRRYAIFYTAQQSKADLVRDGLTEPYFKTLYDWLKREGYRHVIHWLRHSPLDAVEYDPAGLSQRAPSTTSTREAIVMSLGRVEQEIMDAVEGERPGFCKGWISTAAVTKLLEERGVRSISGRKLGEILKSLGYEKIFKSPRRLHEEDNQQPHIYRKGSMTGSIIDYCMAQSYQMSLVGFARPIS